jgi:hypothetical protein
MSTLVAQTISNGTVSTSSANVIQGSAKAWVNFNGTGTVAIRASYNVSSITDNGTGDYTVNFTNALPDANYCVVICAQKNESNSYCGWAIKQGTTNTTSATQLQTWAEASYTFTDMLTVNVTVFD